MKRFCLLGWCAALIAAVVSPCPSLSWSIGALLLLGFTLALIVLFVGFLGRRIGRGRRGVRWVLLTIVILLPTAVLGLHRLNPSGDKARIERTIQAVATSGDPAYCGARVTTAYLEQTTGVKPPFADERLQKRRRSFAGGLGLGGRDRDLRQSRDRDRRESRRFLRWIGPPSEVDRRRRLEARPARRI